MNDQSTGTPVPTPSPDEIKALGYELKDYFKQLGYTKAEIPNSHYHEVAAKLLGKPTLATAIKSAKEEQSMANVTLHIPNEESATVWELDKKTLTLRSPYFQEQILIAPDTSEEQSFRIRTMVGMATLSIHLERCPDYRYEPLSKPSNVEEAIRIINEASEFSSEQLAGQVAFDMVVSAGHLGGLDVFRETLKGIAKEGGIFDLEEAAVWADHLNFKRFMNDPQTALAKSLSDEKEREIFHSPADKDSPESLNIMCSKGAATFILDKDSPSLKIKQTGHTQSVEYQFTLTDKGLSWKRPLYAGTPNLLGMDGQILDEYSWLRSLIDAAEIYYRPLVEEGPAKAKKTNKGDSTQLKTDQSLTEMAQDNPKSINFTDFEHLSVTSGMNGYPEPETGCAIFLDTRADLKAMAERYNLPICQFHWRNGWSNCENESTINDLSPGTLPGFVHYKFNEVIYRFCWDKETFITEKKVSFSEAEWQDYKEDTEEQAETIDQLFQGGASVVTIDESGNIEEHRGLIEGFYYDTHTYRAGLFICKEDGWQIDWQEKIAKTFDQDIIDEADREFWEIAQSFRDCKTLEEMGAQLDYWQDKDVNLFSAWYQDSLPGLPDGLDGEEPEDWGTVESYFVYDATRILHVDPYCPTSEINWEIRNRDDISPSVLNVPFCIGLQDAQSPEAVVKMVNAGVCEGIEGIEFSPEMLAGQYAFTAQEESGYPTTQDGIDAHLEILKESGAIFDRHLALHWALKLLSANP